MPRLGEAKRGKSEIVQVPSWRADISQRWLRLRFLSRHPGCTPKDHAHAGHPAMAWSDDHQPTRCAKTALIVLSRSA